MKNVKLAVINTCMHKCQQIMTQEGHDGPGVAHLGLLNCDSKI